MNRAGSVQKHWGDLHLHLSLRRAGSSSGGPSSNIASAHDLMKYLHALGIPPCRYFIRSCTGAVFQLYSANVALFSALSARTRPTLSARRCEGQSTHDRSWAVNKQQPNSSSGLTRPIHRARRRGASIRIEDHLAPKRQSSDWKKPSYLKYMLSNNQ